MLRVLIAEDELLIADFIAEVLAESGYEVCGTARSAPEAIALGEALEPDLAIIDLHLADGGRGVEVGRRLRSLSPLGVLYTSGSSNEIVLTSEDGDASLSKPFELESLVDALRIVERMAQARKAAPSAPPGFDVLRPPARPTPLAGDAAAASTAPPPSSRDLTADKDSRLSENRRLLIEQSRLIEDAKVLAQEMHHRVRNNLQLIHAMLQKQDRLIGEGAVKDDIGAIARRVMTLAKIHDHLLGAGLSRTVEVGDYLRSLCADYAELEGARRRGIGLAYDFEPLEADLDIVTVLGLVTAELISNSYGHAFPTGHGTISLSLKDSAPPGEATLTVRDDGIGFVGAGRGGRHGRGLVDRLMQQIHGSATVRSDPGVVWTLTFPVSRPSGTEAAGSRARPCPAPSWPSSTSPTWRRCASPTSPGVTAARGSAT